jgi:hypothetical protein
MFKNPIINYLKIITLVLMVFVVLTASPVQAQIAPIPTPTVVIADTPSMLEKIGMRLGSIFFQNIGRKVINDFAYDAATYIGSGGKGQQALFVKEKWGNFWKNVGDKAAGDFIETLAKTVISDVASNSAERKVASRCQAAYDTCAETAGTDETALALCVDKRDKCLGSVKSEEQQETECDQQVNVCKDSCTGTYGSDEAASDCVKNCEITYNYCWSKVAADRKAPTFNADNSPLANVNICSPRLDVLIKIQFGLASISSNRTPYQPNCSFSQMMNNWKNEYDRQKAAITNKNYLNDLVVYFRPGYNDIGAALELQTSLGNYRTEASLNSKAETTATGGWLDIRNFAGDLVGTPDEAASRKKLTDEKLFQNLDKVTGDILVDAANIFINQLLVTGWQNLIGGLADNTNGSSPVSYWSAVSPGRKAIENKISQIKDPVYADGKRLNILADLSSCQKPENPGPTNCVIDTNFSNAITNKMTVAQAMEGGSLQKNWPFGFDKNGQENIQYNQGYSYRSMLILRKYRIVPVGWELAAQKIQQSYLLRDGRALNPNNANALVASVENDFVNGKLKDGVSLEDMVSCFVEGDKYNTYYADWCKGLVDPNWVLKLPDYYCVRQGYGPALVQDFDIQDGVQKSCGQVDASTGDVSKVFVDGGYRNCTVDADCCTRSENASKLKDPSSDCSATCAYKEAKLTFARSNDYCADEQSCIKEDESGKCLSYGYCTEESRQWTFDQKGQDKRCEPYANTCKSYTGNGKNISYLENTLDFNNCTADNAGCREYLMPDGYDQASAKALWSDKAQAIYFDAEAENCAKGNEGCRQLIRTRIDGGANLIADASFEAGDQARWKDFGTIFDKTNPSYDQQLVASGASSLWVSGNNTGIYFTPSDRRLMPKGFEFESNQTYSLSAKIYVVSGIVEMGIGDLARDNFNSVEASGSGWQKYTVTVDNDFSLQANSLKIAGRGVAEFYVDDLKLEVGGPTEYTDYGAADIAYQKLLPNYLERTCYVNPPVDYSLKSDAPAICSTFVRRCNKDEVGCNLFVDILTKDQIAAKVKPKDYCPNECVGYDKFIQQENSFYSARLTHFIPRTAKSCAASQEGCSLFVNLDKVPEGGEENEAFSSFRRCIKPDNSCADFITWEGSDVSGYQITSFKLQANSDNKTISQPRSVVDDNVSDNIDTDENGEELCSEAIFKLPADHPRANLDCRQFFGADGNISYHLYSKTVICVDDCYFYRQVEPNIDETILTEADCEAVVSEGLADARGKWLADQESCVVCREGGVWDETHQSCVFRAWPNESTTCAKTAVGCSKYSGDTGHDLRIIFNDSFEGNNNGNWSGNNGEAQISNDALSVGGHSIQINNSSVLAKNLSTTVKAGKKYTLSFMARRRDQAAKIDSIVMKVADKELVFTSGALGLELSNRWKPYKFVIDNVDMVGALSKLEFRGLENSAELRLDDIKLMEAEDVYYLVKNSWQTPESCDQDHRGRPFPAYMSGCRAYTDMNSERHTLRSFDELCQNSAAGCELMVDTFNSSVYGQMTSGAVTVPADEMAYVVYDAKKSCAANQKGCQYLGRTNRIGALTNIYLINNPDAYNEILCAKNALYCEAWNQAGNNVYFKDPGERVCEYLSLEAGVEGWYVKKQQYCFANQTCSSNADCGDGMACLADDKGAKYCSNMNVCGGQSDCETGQVCKFSTDNNPCPTNAHKTIGTGVELAKLQPYGMAEVFRNAAGQEEIGYAGICQTSAAGCTEYVDPESKFNYNLLLDGATRVSLKADTLYIIKSGLAGEASLSCDGAELYQIDHASNELVKVSEVKAASNAGKIFGQEFYAHRTDTGSEKINCSVSGGATAVREAVVAYRIKDSIARETPTVMKFDEGKILFNERSQNGKTKKSLVYSSDLTEDGAAPNQQAVNPPGNNANTLLAVDPDRTCSQWLACKTYIFNPSKPNERICIERKLCDRLNDANECSHFVGFEPVVAKDSSAPLNQLYNSSETAALKLADLNNMSGYSLAGYENTDWNTDYYNLAGMQEVGGAKLKMDNGGSFEGRSTSGFKTATGTDVPVINDPKVIERELGLEAYREVPDGQAVAKLNASQAVLEIANPGTIESVVSMKVFLRTGAKASLRIGAAEDSSCPLEESCSAAGQAIDSYGPSAGVAETGVVGKWVPLVGRFVINDNYGIDKKLKLWLVSDGVTYFDDLKIEPALSYRSQSGKEQFMQSVCRLFPRGDSLSCDYFDNSGLRRKGWSGYCLQYDPRNAQQCLLWYPIDKVSGDEFEEGASLSIDKDLYYCVEAEDRCGSVASGGSPIAPEFACKTFVKVDKEKYWHGRIGEGSSYLLSPDIFSPVGGKLMVDFGVDNGKTKPGGVVQDSLKAGVDWRQGSGFYGAYPLRESIDSPDIRYPIFAGVTGTGNAKKLLPFVPYFGTSRAGAGGKDDAYLCRATLDKDGHDQPIEVSVSVTDREGEQEYYNEEELGVHDACYVRSAYEMDCDKSGKNQCCKWKYQNGGSCDSQRIWDGDDLDFNDNVFCDKTGGFACKTNACINESGNTACTWQAALFPPDFRQAIYPRINVRNPYFVIDNDNPNAACFMTKGDKGAINGVVYDTTPNSGLTGNGDVGCMFDCFNHTKAYNVGRSIDQAYYAVQRLFTSRLASYTWNEAESKYQESDSAQELQAMTECSDSGRPAFSKDNPLADYCYIKPVVNNVKVSPARVVNQGYVTLTFTSKVDAEQLPLRRVVVHYLGKNGAKTRSFNLSIFDHRDPANPHKFLLSYDAEDLGLAPGESRTITPCVEVYDNWYDAQSVLADNSLNSDYMKSDIDAAGSCVPLAESLVIERSN